MKVVLLAGGYATRLWPLTKDTPKALLDVGEKTILEHVLHLIERMPQVRKVYLTTNQKFEPNFRKFVAEWKGVKPIEIIVEKSMSNDEKYGAVGGLLKLWESQKFDEKTLIMAADNVFDSGFADLLNRIVAEDEDAIVLHDVKDTALAKIYGVCKLDKTGRIIDFEEKPARPRSTLVSTGCYVLSGSVLAKLPEYEASGGGVDRIGDFIKWLVHKTRVRGYIYEGPWFDIGTHEHLARARQAHEKN